MVASSPSLTTEDVLQELFNNDDQDVEEIDLKLKN